MAPTIRPGRLVVGVGRIVVSAGDVVIIRHNGLEKIKRVKYRQGDQVFVVGDNPHHSTDSREFGWLPATDVVAKVVWPLFL